MASLRLTSRAAALTLAVIALPVPLFAQFRIAHAPASWVGAPVEEYARLLQLTGVMPLSSRMIRPADTPVRWIAPDSAPWRAPWSARFAGPRRTGKARDSARFEVTLFDPLSQSTYNSDYPSGMNDGAMWAGRGTSTELTAGAALRASIVTLQIAPTYTWSENQPFPLAALANAPATASPFSDAWFSRGIDRPQRFGTHAVSRLDAGQSAVSVATRGVRAGWSNESMWWGPGIDNAVMLTNNAAGFNHAYVGTQHPANVWLGTLEALYSVGWLKQSDFWRTAADTFPTDRWLNALAVVFSPRGSPGLYIGASRAFYAYEQWNPITLRELATIVQGLEKKSVADSANPSGNDRRDQLASLWLRWVFPDVGFEVYGEYARNDHNWDGRDLALEPDHSRAYQIGLQKVYSVRDGLLAVRGEATNMTKDITTFFRPTPIWYVHHRVQQGYTQRGQVLGAGIGPGSDDQTLAVDWFERRGRIGFMLRRSRVNTDAIVGIVIGPDDRYLRHDTYLEAGPRLTLFSGPVDVNIEYRNQYEFNRYMIMKHDVRNQHLELIAQVRLP